MSAFPPCPSCASVLTYADGESLVCPECAHEWLPQSANAVESEVEPAVESTVVVRDAFGNMLQDGDTVIVIKDLKVKGASFVVKVGTKVRVLRVVDGDHNIDCRIEGVGQMGLKSEFVKKA